MSWNSLINEGILAIVRMISSRTKRPTSTLPTLCPPSHTQGHRIKIGGLGRMANSAFRGKLNLCGTSSYLFTIFVVALVVDNKYNVYVR